MKKYVITCETMHRAEYLWKAARYYLGDLVHYIHKSPILNIETYDGVLLYFTSYDMWYGRQELGRRDFEVVHEWKFEMMLKAWFEPKAETSTEVTRNNGLFV